MRITGRRRQKRSWHGRMFLGLALDRIAASSLHSNSLPAQNHRGSRLVEEVGLLADNTLPQRLELEPSRDVRAYLAARH
jgi:hypothetical protein